MPLSQAGALGGDITAQAGAQWDCRTVLICDSPKTSDVGHLSMGLHHMLIHTSVKCLFRTLVHI